MICGMHARGVEDELRIDLMNQKIFILTFSFHLSPFWSVVDLPQELSTHYS